MNGAEILQLDQDHVWHPYAAMPNGVPCFPVEKASGCKITLSDGKVLVDGMSSWWSCIHGYNHPILNAAAEDQMKKMSHMMFGGLTHEPAARLAKELAKITPGSGDRKLDKIFYCDSGSVSVEVAMKMALQYWFNKGKSERNRFLTVRGGYHGDTFEAMSVCDPVNGMHHLWNTNLPQQIFCDRPKSRFDEEEWDESDINNFRETLEQNQEDIAAVILEPIVQGTGCMRFYSPQYLQRVRDLCDEYDILLICDEIATGFGRTGKLFAVEHARNAVPDILCIGKALSGGFLSFAATITSPRVAAVFEQGPAGVLMHGPTFMGNPLACAVSLASLQILQSSDWKKSIQSIETQLASELAPCRDSPHVQDVRVLGAIGVVEMKEPMDMKVVQPRVVEGGVWLRPFGRLLYTMPPFIIQPDELRRITKAMVSIATRRRA
eukprot:scaffold22589_cov138-Cylindrotheca_fusiformis.AAC.4